MDSSACSTAESVSAARATNDPDSLDDTLVVIEALEDNFGDLAKWFESFEGTRARDVIGFDLAMDLCGCYELVLRRLGKGIRDIFGRCKFIQSARELQDAEQVLLRLESILTAPSELDSFRDIARLVNSEAGPGSVELQTALGGLLSHHNTDLLSAFAIRECLDVHWRRVLELISALIFMVENGNKLLVESANECTAHQSELTSSRDEISRLHRELGKGRKLLTELKLNRSIESQTASGTVMHLEAVMTELQKAQAHVDRLTEAHAHSQEKCYELKLNTDEIVLTHEREKDQLNWTLHEVRSQLRERDITLSRVKEDHVKEQEGLNRQIASLTERNGKLTMDIAALEHARLEAVQSYNKLQTVAQRQQGEQEVQLSDFRGIIDELQCRITKGEENAKAGQVELVFYKEETDKLTDEIHRLGTCKRVLSSLCDFLGVQTVDRWESLLPTILAERDASVDRIGEVLKRTCVKRDTQDIQATNDPDKMDFVTHTGDMFTTYEVVITGIIQSLDNAEPRPKKVAQKRRQSFGSQGLTIKREYASPEDVGPDETKLQSTEGKCEQDMWSLDIKSHTDHNNVDSFDIELRANATHVRTPIPNYIAKSLGARGDLKILELGHLEPLVTLLKVLQAEDEIEACAEITQNKCHCQEMEQFSNRLKCTLFICWTPSGDHEVYGDDDRTGAVYTIIVHKRKDVRRYYLLVVKPKGEALYMYNFGKVPFKGQYNVPSNKFVHIADGTCQGPGSTHNVITVTTNDLVLNDDV